MEVHHHAHHEGNKTWKSYFWEFLMLFFAVFCGFMAEYQLEHMIEHQREEVYVKSMIEDAETDLGNIKEALASNVKRMQHLDSLAYFCNLEVQPAAYDSLLYRHFLFGLYHPDVITPTERTIMQLKNAGGMRLLRKKNAVDEIVKYDELAKKLAGQQVFYEQYQNNSISLATQLFYFQQFGFNRVGTEQQKSTKTQNDFKLFSKDKAKTNEFANQVMVYSGVVSYYNLLLEQMQTQAEKVIQTLKMEYKLE